MQQVEGLLVIVLLVVEGRRLDTALHALTGLALVDIVLEGTDVHKAGVRDVLVLIGGLRLLLQTTLLHLLGTNEGAAEEQTQK